jgi:hypothetical protein
MEFVEIWQKQNGGARIDSSAHNPVFCLNASSFIVAAKAVVRTHPTTHRALIWRRAKI